MNNHKLTKKLQVLLTEDEVNQINYIILNNALSEERRPVSISAFLRILIQKELNKRSIEEKTTIKHNLKNLKNK